MGFFKRNVERGTQRHKRLDRSGLARKSGSAKKVKLDDKSSKRKAMEDEEIPSSEGEDDELFGVRGADEEELASDQETGPNEEGENLEYEDSQALAYRETKKLLESVKQREEEDNELDEAAVGDSIAARLREEAQAKVAKLHKQVADQTRFGAPEMAVSHRAHRLSPICVCFSSQGQFLFSCSKDGTVVKYDVANRRRVGPVLRCATPKSAKSKNKAKKDGESTENAHTGPVLCCAMSPDDNYLCTGGHDGLVKLWEFESLAHVRDFTGHRGPVNALRFRRQCPTLELFSASADKSIKVWNLDEMGLMNTLYGHEDAIQQLDILQWPRLVSCGGMDKSCRLFKVLEDSHLVFNGFAECVSIDCVALINEEHFVSGSMDGSLYVWATARKKPVCVLRRAHGAHPASGNIPNQSAATRNATAAADESGEPRWICAVACLAYTDLVASGSSDGQLRLWRVAQDYKSMQQVDAFQLPGFINDIRFSPDGRWIACAVGQEHKGGRWWRLKGADGVHNRVALIPLAEVEGDDERRQQKGPEGGGEEMGAERTMVGDDSTTGSTTAAGSC